MTAQEIVDAAQQVRELEQEVHDMGRLIDMLETRRVALLHVSDRWRRKIAKALYEPEEAK